jgi:hypothetical protein
MDWRAIFALTSLGLASVGCKGAAASGKAADNPIQAPAAATGGGDARPSAAGSAGSGGRTGAATADAGSSTAGTVSHGPSAAAGAGVQSGGAGAGAAGRAGSGGATAAGGSAGQAAAGASGAAEEDAGAAGSAGGVCNLACVRGKHCEVVQVQCIRAPCPAVAQCIDDMPRVTCGGFAARPCPGAGQCVDDPADGCDPKHGGADCGGICECSKAGSCTQGQHWDSDATVCDCTP